MGGKSAYSAHAAPDRKTTYVAPSDVGSRLLRFRFDLVDSRNWPLHRIQRADHERLLKRLAYFEGLTVQQARDNKILADYSMADCPNKNARRILQNKFEGQDSLTRLTIEPSGDGRLFGIRDANEIHVLWWDASHDVWPEGKIRR